MSILKEIASSVLRAFGSRVTVSDLEKLAKTAQKKAENQTKTYTFSSLPADVEALKALPEASLQDPYAVAALSVLALTPFQEDRGRSVAMLNFLKGPDPLSPREVNDIADRFMDGKFYKVNSFFEGATPRNNYTPARPYRVQVQSNPYSFKENVWATLYLVSGGADSPRPVLLRKKPSTGQWFLVEIQYLADIRIPLVADKWA